MSPRYTPTKAKSPSIASQALAAKPLDGATSSGGTFVGPGGTNARMSSGECIASDSFSPHPDASRVVDWLGAVGRIRGMVRSIRRQFPPLPAQDQLSVHEADGPDPEREDDLRRHERD